MTLNPSNELQKVEDARKTLQKDKTLTSRQSSAITKAIELLNESKKGGRIDRHHSRGLLLDIYNRFGIDVLLLCSVSLSITKLAEMKRNAARFFCELGAWKISAEITPEVHDLATRLLAPVLSGIEAKKTKEKEALVPNPTTNDGKGKRKLPVKKKLTPVKRTKVGSSEQSVNDIPGRVEWRVQQPTPNEGSADANGGARTECDDLVKEESQSPPASHSKVIYAHTPEDEDGIVPLYATVVDLEPMDAIRAIVLQGEPKAWLTIPDDERSTPPFVTVRCPMPLALRFKAIRGERKWS
ncbi:unnamed protein product [Clonostachys chloroleuca]|uniref:Uncharacterized protein n=1 Tax=Clonostachys chloroleuca TaxID=1926264 RepID=A0AA35Q8S0_9HYPO|nr:unnamed protein product [Clonostachys chloroleuca]